MQVDVFHRDNLCISTTAGSAFYSEYGSERRLAQGKHGVFAEQVHSVCKAYAHRGFALSEGSGVHSRDENEFRFALFCRNGHFGFVFAVEFDVVVGVSELVRYFGNGDGLCLSCNFNVA